MKLLLCSHAERMIGKAASLFEINPDQLKTVCITTAAEIYPADNRAWFDSELKAFVDNGFKLERYNLKDQTSEQVAAKLHDADIIYVTGGNSYYLLQHMQTCNFKDILQDRLNKGAIYIGSSAGSVVTCPAIDYIGDLDDVKQASLTDMSGFGLIDFNIMPHIDHPKFKDKISKLVEAQRLSETSLIGLRDDQAVLVIDNYIQIITADH